MNRLRQHLVAIAALWLCAQLGLAATPFAAWCCESDEASTAGAPSAGAQPAHRIAAAPPHESHGADPADEDACCKGLGPGQTCPLHKHRKASSGKAAPKAASASHHDAQAPVSRSADAACEVRAACNPSNTAPVPVSFEAGVVPTTFVLLHLPTAAVVPDVTMAALIRAERPDSPPPRG